MCFEAHFKKTRLKLTKKPLLDLNLSLDFKIRASL